MTHGLLGSAAQKKLGQNDPPLNPTQLGIQRILSLPAYGALNQPLARIPDGARQVCPSTRVTDFYRGAREEAAQLNRANEIYYH